MKTIIQTEKVEYKCDVCGIIPEWGVDAAVEFNFGYGSSRDGDHNSFHFCSPCAEKFWALFSKEYPTLKLIEEDHKW